MKYSREIKVGLVSILCLFLLYYGFYFLKGTNLFSPSDAYHGVFTEMRGLTEQRPVYIRGYKVGQVDRITYDFLRDSSFVVDISIDKSIVLPVGTKMALVTDGLLGGMAIELQLPSVEGQTAWERCPKNSTLPTLIEPGLLDNLQDGLLASLSETVDEVKGLVKNLSTQLEGDHLSNTLANVDRVTSDLTVTSKDLKSLMHNQVPAIVENVDSTITSLNIIVSDLREADIAAKVDTVVNGVSGLVGDLRSQEGTIGKLLYDKSLYQNINATVISADSLLTDIKAHPRHYLYPLGAKEKKKK